MLGQLVIMPQSRGDTFSATGLTYALCNGQSLLRSSFSSLSAVWPSGAYGSDDTNLVLPDFTDNFLRGCDFERDTDPSVATRSAQAGNIPVTSGIGSFQAFALESHSHNTGTTTQGGSRANNGGDTCFTSNQSADSGNPVMSSTNINAGDTFAPNGYVVYVYMQVTTL